MILMQICTEKEYNNWLNNKLIAKFDPSTLEFQKFVPLNKAKKECLYNFNRWYVTSCTIKDINLIIASGNSRLLVSEMKAHPY